MAKNPRLIDLHGQRFGRWVVTAKAGNSPRGAALWHTNCDCGAVGVVVGSDLRKGKSVSCGCFKREVASAIRRTHGESKSRLHNIWKMMRRRCLFTDNPDYGGRGISICAEWSDYAMFRDWALANGYASNLSIERKDVNGDYTPANCTWADAETQANNRRFVRKMPDGTPAPLVAKTNGIPARTFNVRVHAGWSIEEAATHPYKTRRVERGRGPDGKFL